MGFWSGLSDIIEKASDKYSELSSKVYDDYDKFYRCHKNKSLDDLKRISNDTSRSRVERQAAYDLYKEKQ